MAAIDFERTPTKVYDVVRRSFEPVAALFQYDRDNWSTGEKFVQVGTICVDQKWQQQYRIWVDKTPDRLFVIFARCTHLGCTPDWKASENKFKCPCHGSGYDSEGINFEGPAPRPMDRALVDKDAEGQIVVDTGKLFKWPKGERKEFDDPGAFIQL